MARMLHSLHHRPTAQSVIRTMGSLVMIAGLALSWHARTAGAQASIAEAGAIKAQSVAELQRYLDGREANVDLFRARGPFGVAIQENRTVRLTASERVEIDVFLSAPTQKAPLVIFLHGHDSSKRAHGKQASHLASWGMHGVSVQLARNGPWESNGRTLARLVSFVSRSPQAIDSRIDTSRIILVGHSFGAYAVAVALAEGAPAAGAILLDPGAVGKGSPAILRRIQKPVMVLGADDELSTPRNRDYFYEYVRGAVAEVSIRDAVHEDAQYPSEFALRNGGVDPDTTEELQVTFVSALTAAALSLAATGSFDYAWTSFRLGFENSRFFDPKKK
jgi:pimeloyl-ACP methyl ester carboxylesterase